MSFTPAAAPYNECDNITAGSNTVSLQDFAHDEIVNKVSELDDQTTAQAESIAKNVQDIAANAENIAANTADITELKSNNYLVEIKDTVTENTNYETHDVKETSSDGTENQVSNFVLAAKQITGISVDADAASMTISSVNQTGAAETETLTLPSGGTAYDDTQVKADIATNAANIATNTANIATNTSDIADLKTKAAGLTITQIGTLSTSTTLNAADYSLLLLTTGYQTYTFTFLMLKTDGDHQIFLTSDYYLDVVISTDTLSLNRQQGFSNPVIYGLK